MATANLKTWDETTGLPAVMKFLEMKPGEFRKEWEKLTDQDKTDLKKGIDDRSLTY